MMIIEMINDAIEDMNENEIGSAEKTLKEVIKILKQKGEL